jgi:hypothetical protein
MNAYTKSTLAPVSTDARLLVRTWLHDEGSHTEVVELGRDLLLTANVLDIQVYTYIRIYICIYI